LWSSKPVSLIQPGFTTVYGKSIGGEKLFERGKLFSPDMGQKKQEDILEEDEELVHKIQAGDTEAFNSLMQKYYKSVLNLVYRFYGCGREEAEDSAQEVFLRIYRSIHRFEGRSSFFTYLYKVTMNLCFKKRVQMRKCSSTSIEELQEGAIVPKDGIPSTEACYQRKELGKIIQDAVLTLPEEQKAVVLLNKYHDLSYEKIAEILHISLPAVKSRLHRAKLALKEKLAPLVEE
jgi:RNA polymerase sigma-70 factor, ECF subfamily